MTLGIYIHIPFCVKKCPYCDFTSFTPGAVPEDEYVNAVMREIAIRSEEVGGKGFETIYFGGGTPSLLSPKGMAAIIEAVCKHFIAVPPHPDPLPQGAREITLEVNPGTVNPDKLRGFRDAGVNRLSIGVQSLNDRLLSTLGRIHTRQEALTAYDSARKAGFENIGIDLIHSKPGETLPDWKKDLSEAVSLRPEHISAYNLTIEDETHFFHLQEKGHLRLPQEEEQAEMFVLTTEILEKAGYEHYEVSNYALPGFRSRHNQIYWKGGEYLGLGVSAHSYIISHESGARSQENYRGPSLFTDEVKRSRRIATVPGVRTANTSSLEEYFRLVNEKGNAVVEEEVLTKEKAMGEAVFLGLRMMEGISMKGFEDRFGVTLDACYSNAIKEFMEEGMLEKKEGHLRLTEKGILFLNEVSVRFV